MVPELLQKNTKEKACISGKDFKAEPEIKYVYTEEKDSDQKINKAFDLLFNSVFETFKSG